MAQARICKITKTTVEGLKPGEQIRDTELKGFGARRQKNSLTYFLYTRVAGRGRRITIGRHGSPWTADSARKEASRLLLSVRTGNNPILEREAARARQLTFQELSQQFLEIHGPTLKPRTLESYTTCLELRLRPKFGSKPINEITHQAIAKAHASWRTHKTAANNTLTCLSAIFGWAEAQKLLPKHSNPCPDIKRYKTSQKERFLTRAELKRLGDLLNDWEASQKINTYAAFAIRLLIVTGARLTEILTLRWSYVLWEQKCLQLPDSKTGFKYIILNEHALAILSTIPTLKGNPYVIVGSKKSHHFVGLKKVWRALRTAANIQDVRIHDLRHSFASLAINHGGSSLPLLGNILGHSDPKTTARYAHIAADPARTIAEATGKHISTVWYGDTEIPVVRAKPIVRYTVAQRLAQVRARRQTLLLPALPLTSIPFEDVG